MGNNPSQELEAKLTPSVPPVLQQPHEPHSNDTTLGGNPVGPIIKAYNRSTSLRSTGTSTHKNVYEASCLYRRKVYAESLPRLKRPSKTQTRNVPLPTPPIHLGNRHAVKLQPGPPKSATKGLQESVAQQAVSRPLMSYRFPCHANQQWNGNNWTDVGSESILTSKAIVSDENDTAIKAAKPLSKLIGLRELIDRFDTELSRSKISLKKRMDSLTDTDLLIGRNALEQKELLCKTEESVISTQSLLAKMHQHIANTHEFCNMLHRIDESLQMFSKAAFTVSAWEQIKQEDSSKQSQ
ncbi:unnamed protein product [Mesocestoides corti]|uniref:Uncharacterized protein n=1 Tax=Mesocestoides corti TaxID=53468 RepID=A0A0R3UFJ9_MESCO|nr:unnamed protein product [Mesocestoides corti]